MKLHLGCGWRDFGKEWTHIDDGDYDHLDHKSHINKLPMIEENSVDIIYASHCIAYFDRDEIEDVLIEWWRVLKPGGVLRLGTPDFEVMVNLYQKGVYNIYNILGPLYGKMPMDEVTIYHKTTYDYFSLNNLLIDMGFSDVVRWNWRDTEHSEFDDHSQAYYPHMDKENGTLISLNIECRK
jgi:predicted SAM-dependent methyltransferase